jgi:hypothetical protein
VRSLLLLRPLIHPRANQSHLFRGERRNLGLVVLRRHPSIFLADLRHAEDETALGAVARLHHLAVLRAFESGFEADELQAGLGFFVAVTFYAGGFENGFDVVRKSDVGFGGGGRKFGDVRVSGQLQRGNQRERKNDFTAGRKRMVLHK